MSMHLLRLTHLTGGEMAAQGMLATMPETLSDDHVTIDGKRCVGITVAFIQTLMIGLVERDVDVILIMDAPEDFGRLAKAVADDLGHGAKVRVGKSRSR